MGLVGIVGTAPDAKLLYLRFKGDAGVETTMHFPRYVLEGILMHGFSSWGIGKD